MAKILHLFAGAHKTATTALQIAACQHAASLQKHGILYPCEATLPGSGIPANHSALIANLFEQEPRRDKRRQTLQPQCDNSLQRWHTMLASESDLLVVAESTGRLSSRGLQELASSVADHGFVLKTYYTVTQPSRYFYSTLQQRIKHCRSCYCLNPGLRQPLRLAERFARVVDNLPNTEILRFETACAQSGGPTPYYLRAVMADRDPELLAAVAGTHANRSGCDQAVRFCSWLNERGQEGESAMEHEARIRFVLHLFRTLKGSPFRPMSSDVDNAWTAAEVERQTVLVNAVLSSRQPGGTSYTNDLEWSASSAPWTEDLCSQFEQILEQCPDHLRSHGRAYFAMVCGRSETAPIARADQRL